MANTPKVKNIRVREIVDSNNNTSYKIVVVVKHDDADSVATVGVDFIPPYGESPAPSASSAVCVFKAENSAKDKKRYVNKTITFGAGALDSPYNMTATMKAANGATIGTPMTMTVVVEDKEDDVPPPSIASVSITKTGSTYNVYVMIMDDTDSTVGNILVDLVAISRTSPLPEPPSLVCTFKDIISGQRRFANEGGLSFSADATGAEYFLTCTMRTAAGVAMAPAVTLSAVVS